VYAGEVAAASAPEGSQKTLTAKVAKKGREGREEIPVRTRGGGGSIMKHQETGMRTSMRKTFLLLVFVVVSVTAWAAEMQGTIVAENSVACGSEAKGKKSTQLMCQEYVIRTDSTEYHVRQEKEAHKALLPVNAPVELTLKKDKMKFKVNGKEYEMLVVSESAAPAAPASAAPAPKP
jgi:hypothetical protein